MPMPMRRPGCWELGLGTFEPLARDSGQTALIDISHLQVGVRVFGPSSVSSMTRFVPLPVLPHRVRRKALASPHD